MRISSTQLNDFKLCPRRWAFNYAGGLDEGAGRAAAVGSVIHACLEHHISEGRWPTLAEVQAMPGNYDPPSAALAKWGDSLWAEAQASLAATPSPWQHIPQGFETFEVEKSLEDWGLTISGVTLGGYVDLFALSEDGRRALVFDWKTKGAKAWGHRPNAESLHDNTQLLYYAACVAKANPTVREVQVAHANLLRVTDASKAQPADVITTVLAFHELEAFWRLLVGELVPSLVHVSALYADPATREAIPADRSACFAFGRCPHLARCNALTAAPKLGLDTFTNLNKDDGL
jgi:hypothetical protein